MKRDQKLVALFLEKYNELTNDTFQVTVWEDENERNKPAVEAIAVNESGATVAIEHTLLEPFVGEREDTVRFLKAIGSLEQDASLRLRDYTVHIIFNVGVIPKGVDWTAINPAIREWIRGNIGAFPTGRSTHIIPNLPFELSVALDKSELPRYEGRIFFMRDKLPASLTEVVRTSFTKKLPKLVATDADSRILLLEQNDIAHGSGTIHDAVKSVGQEFPEMAKIDEIWVVMTIEWERYDYLSYFRVYPDVKDENEFRDEE